MKKTKKNNLSNYIDYLKDNPKGYWFKRKLYGWGWIPATWEGWLTTLIFVIAIVFVVQEIVEKHGMGVTWGYWTTFALLIILLFLIGYKKGERPKWQWGFRRN